jgi:hypothetical protein
MPVRNRTREIKGGPQGIDARMTISLPTVDESQTQINLAKELGDNPEELEREARAYIARHIIGWNWVDDAGQPMTLPSIDHDVIGSLTGEELGFIAEALAGAKNGQPLRVIEKK